MRSPICKPGTHCNLLALPPGDRRPGQHAACKPPPAPAMRPSLPPLKAQLVMYTRIVAQAVHAGLSGGASAAPATVCTCALQPRSLPLNAHTTAASHTVWLRLLKGLLPGRTARAAPLLAIWKPAAPGAGSAQLCSAGTLVCGLLFGRVNQNVGTSNREPNNMSRPCGPLKVPQLRECSVSCLLRVMRQNRTEI